MATIASAPGGPHFLRLLYAFFVEYTRFSAANFQIFRREARLGRQLAPRREKAQKNAPVPLLENIAKLRKNYVIFPIRAQVCFYFPPEYGII